MNYLDHKRAMAAKFVALADDNAASIMTSDMYTENFVFAFKAAEHMAKGGSYSGRESAMVFTQLNKLKRHLGLPTTLTSADA